MPDATLHPDGPISVVTLNRPSRPVHGYAVGCGFEWMLNGDMVVAAQDLVCFFPRRSGSAPACAPSTLRSSATRRSSVRGVSPPPMSPWATRCNWRATSGWTAFSASRCSATGRPCASARPSGVRCRPSTTPRWNRGYQFSRRRTFGRDRAAPVVLPALA